MTTNGKVNGVRLVEWGELNLEKARKADLVALLTNAPLLREKEKNSSFPERFRLGMTVSLGVGIPLLSLAMSKLAGTLASAGKYLLGLAALGLMVAVLSVSLAHLSWSIENLTRSSKRASWALAIALDVSLIVCEAVEVWGGRGLHVVECACIHLPPVNKEGGAGNVFPCSILERE
jgi:hypothetical protein